MEKRFFRTRFCGNDAIPAQRFGLIDGFVRSGEKTFEIPAVTRGETYAYAVGQSAAGRVNACGPQSFDISVHQK